MATKRADIKGAVRADMEGRNFGIQTTHEETTEGLQAAHKRPTMEAIRIRMPEADLRALDALAASEGSNRSTLIRRAIKDLLKRGR